LSIAHKTYQHRLVAPALESNHHILSPSPLLQAKLVRKILMMKAGSINGFLNSETEVDHVNNNMQKRVDDGGSTETTDDQKQVFSVRDERGSHSRKRTLPRDNGVGFSLDEPISIGYIYLAGEVVHFIVHQNATPQDGHSRPKASVESVCVCNSVAV